MKIPVAKKQRTFEDIDMAEVNLLKRENSEKMDSKKKIDTDLYSRQLGTYGIEMMSKLVGLDVLIINVKSVGLECAKNLILCGPKSVCIYDNDICEVSDIGVNFYINEENVKRKECRSDAVIQELKSLNSYVNVYNIKEITKEIISTFDIVVCCDINNQEIINYNNIVRSIETKNIAFLCCNIYGLCGYIFVDFNKNFICYDRTGEEINLCIINKIYKGKETKIYYDFEKSIPFENGDYVLLENLEGMNELNKKIFKIKDLTNYTFTIDIDSTTFNDYVRNGTISLVKIPLKLYFENYENYIKNPLKKCEKKIFFNNDILYEEMYNNDSFLITDFAKMDMSNQLHYAIQSLKKYETEKGKLPNNIDDESFEIIYNYAVELNNNDKKQQLLHSVDEIKKDIVYKTAKYSTSHIAPVASFFGGILCQEIVKFTGKYMPIYQIMYVDFFECVSFNDVSKEEIKIENSTKNDGIISIFGKSFQKKLNDLNIFLVGSGALGCEYAKLFSLMDISINDPDSNKKTNGFLTITDNDHIEVSNLNRQFLFRRQHVGQSKSKIVKEVILRKNKNMNVEALEHKVGVENEHIFNDHFWNKQNIIVNALDNIQARQYVDSKCIWHLKPLLESGTLGTKGNVQVVIPFLTQSYNDSYDPAEDSIPLCTLKHFPYDIIHTIEYARDAFQGIFYNTPLHINQFVNNKDEFLRKIEKEGNNASQLEMLQTIITTINEINEKNTFENCIKKAAEYFQQTFINQILQLLHSFPADYRLSSGELFWVGHKRIPTPLKFDFNEPYFLEFILSTSNLLAQVYNIPECKDINYIKQVLNTLELEQFEPKKVNVKIDENDLNNITITEINEPKVLEDYIKELKNIDIKGLKITPIEFDKDNDDNMHVDFIYTFANLRANNYKIPNCDKLKAKIVSGKIIPALATTTSIITGLVCIELLKYVNYYQQIQEYVKISNQNEKIEKNQQQQQQILSYFKNVFINSSIPMFIFSEPMPPLRTVDKNFDEIMKAPVRAIPNGFSSWDRIEINIKNGTIQNLLDYLNNKYNIEINLISVGNVCLYNCYLPIHNKERINMPIHELYMKITKNTFKNDVNYIILDVCCTDENMIDVLIPTIKFIFK